MIISIVKEAVKNTLCFKRKLGYGASERGFENCLYRFIRRAALEELWRRDIL